MPKIPEITGIRSSRGFRIGEWEVQPRINSVKKADRSFHLEPKVMQVLVELATHANEVLTKEQLIHAVWPDTFVGDDVLTRCVSEIRRVLQDDARSPKFIQTIPKAGYRLIAPVVHDNPDHHADIQSAFVAGVSSAAEDRASTEHAATREHRGNSRALWMALLLAVILIFGLGGFILYRYATAHSQTDFDSNYKIVPFTSYPGAQTQPVFSPDGNQVAFVWNGEKEDNQDIYIKMIGTETPLRLTSDPAEDFSPAWSPDGRTLAFLRYSDADRGIYLVPALGGAARKIFTPLGKIEWERGALSWSPDGKRLVFPDGKSSKSPSAIYSLDLLTGDAKQITTPPSLWDGDASPAFSPDGTKIAFARGIEGWVRDVYVMNASGGKPVQLTFDGRMVSSLAWSHDSTRIIFSSNRSGKFSLWRVPVTGGDPERLPVGSEDAFSPAISPTRLAYTQKSSTWSIRQIDLQATKNPPVTIWSSTEEDSAPQYSPSGNQVAFQSLRSGTQEIWVAARDGSNPVKLTSFERSLTGSPSWSPDGTQLALDARPDRRSHIYTIRLDGGLPRQLTQGDFNDIVPRWSHDGNWIYFGSNRSGAWQIWRVSSSGGVPQQITRQGGFVGAESYDGQWVYFAKSDSPGVWRVPVAGGEEKKVLNQPRIGYWGYWTLVKNGIYFLDQTGNLPVVMFSNLDGEHAIRIRTLEHNPPPYAGLTVAPDERFLLFSDQVEVGSHITLVNGFR